MTTAATISARLTLDQSDYDKGLAVADKKASAFGDKLKQVGGKLFAIGGGMTAGFTLPIVAGFGGAISAASDLSESANALNVVFGDSSDMLHEFGATAATEVGLAESEFNQLGAVTGAFLTNLGFDQRAAADETINLTERASDMASIFNTDVSQALSAIQSGLKGEFNPLERFGVKMNAASIQAKALEMGLADQNGKLDDNAKAQAALALLYAQTDKFAGDFKNTSDGFANSTRILTAELKNQAAQLGQELLPYVLKGVQFFRELIAKFNELSPSAKRFIIIALLIVAVLGPILMLVGGIITAIGAIIPVLTAVAGAIAAVGAPILILIVAIIAILALLYLAWKNNWGGIRDKFAAFMKWFKPIWDKLWQGALAIFEIFKRQFQTLVAAFHAAMKGDWYRFGQLLRVAWDRAWNTIKRIAQLAWNNLKLGAKLLIQTIVDYFRNTDWKEVGMNIVRGIVNGLDSLRQWAIDAIWNLARSMASAFNGFFGIQSPSKWAEQRADLISQGFEKQWARRPIVMSPAPVLAGMPTPSTAATASSPSSSDGEIVALLRQLINRDAVTESVITRVLRDAILSVRP